MLQLPTFIHARRYTLGGGSNLFLDESGLGSADGAWSVSRNLRSAFGGSAFRVRRSSDSTEQDIGFSGEDIDTSSLSSFCSGTDGFVVTIYDQSGNSRNLTQSTASQQPQIVSSGTIYTGANGKPECRFDGSNDRMVATSWSLAAPMTIFAVMKHITWSTAYLMDGTTANGIALTGITSSPTVRILLSTSPLASLTNGGMTVGSPVMLSLIWNTTSRFQVNNNTETTGGDGTSRSPGGISLGSSGSATFYAAIGFQETAVYSGEKNSTDRSTAKSNINSFYTLY